MDVRRVNSSRSIKGYGIKCSSSGCENEATHKHHKDRNRKNNNQDNLAYLCASCHRLSHDDGIDLKTYDLCSYFNKHREGMRISHGARMLEDGYIESDYE